MKLYNTLTASTEDFEPIDGSVKLYVCGITPYAASHVGHAMRAVVFDVLRRYLEFRGYKVMHVENFTDIDDKMIAKATELDVTTNELADQHIRDYMEDMEALNVLPAHRYPRATEEIPEIVEMIRGLEDGGHAYTIEGSVYFRVRSDGDYGKLSRRQLDSLRAGARVEIDARKEDSMDFALWKGQKPGEPAWDSPWGPGRPGWHIECSAMSMKYLGECLDIHGGGQDLIFPHHENEVAQTESYTHKEPMARFWMHNGMVQLGDEEMSKSQGIFVTSREAVETYSSDALRLFFLSSHYRSPLKFTDESVGSQERAAERLRQAASAESAATGDVLDPKPFQEQFIEAMDDDLNTPRAVAALFDLSREINRASGRGDDPTEAQSTLGELSGVLGLTLEEPRDDSGDVGPLVELLIETRESLRADRQFDAADRIRDRLVELGYVLEDTPRGTEWKRRG